MQNDLHSDELAAQAPEDVALVKARKLKGPDFMERIGGSMTDDDLSPEGNRFARSYFDFDRGAYLADYEKHLAADLPSLYHVPNTWKSYDTIKASIDRRYAAWKAKARRSRATGKKAREQRGAKKKR